MAPDFPSTAITRIPLDSAGEFLIGQATGYLHLWQFEDASGNALLDGVVYAQPAGQLVQAIIPLAYNSRLQLARPLDRWRITWPAQPGRVAVLLTAANARDIEADNRPAKNLIVPATSLTGSITKLTVGTADILALGFFQGRQRAIVACDDANTVPIWLSFASGSGVGNGWPVNPGMAFEMRSQAPLWAISAIANQTIRTWQEF